MSYAVAFDIGGTKIEAALFNDKYKILAKKRVLINENYPRKRILKTIFSLIDKLKIKKIKGIGICVTDIVKPDGMILECKIKGLSNTNLKKIIERKYRCRAFIANDADCFAIAEHKLGAAKKAINSIGVICGTGVGSGIIINNKIYTSTKGSAGEFGHNIINVKGPKSRTGLRGEVESYIGGDNLVRNYKKAGGKIKNPDPKKIFFSKEKTAKRVMNEALEIFGIGLASLVNIFDPDVIVLGGGLSNLPIYKKINRITKRYVIKDFRKNIKIVKNKLGDSAGIYGAASLVFR